LPCGSGVGTPMPGSLARSGVGRKKAPPGHHDLTGLSVRSEDGR
jgi:hypothetical protein